MRVTVVNVESKRFVASFSARSPLQRASELGPWSTTGLSLLSMVHLRAEQPVLLSQLTKYQCDGQQPCATCDKKHFTCTYTDHARDGSSPAQPSAKRRTKESDVSSRSGALKNGGSPSATNYLPDAPLGLKMYRPGGSTPSIGDAARSISYLPHRADSKPEIRVNSDHASNSGGDEEAENHTMTRMLEDSTGRLIYIGDASTLSFLQLLRMIVETTEGPSPFTLDPERHRIKEPPFSLPPDTELTHLLPEKQTAMILVDSFFVNVSMNLSQTINCH